jgi:hypothetical protein
VPSPQSLQQSFVQLQEAHQHEKANVARLHEYLQREKANVSNFHEKYQQEKVKGGSLQRQNEALREECRALKEWANELQAQNEEFRTQIFSMGSGRGPVQDEDHYIQSFDELKYVVEHSMVKFSRAHANQSMPARVQTEVLTLISDLGQNGKNSARILTSGKYNFQALYSNGRWRHPLIRHIVALFLQDRIFDTFALCLSQEFSEGLKCVEKDVISRGPPQKIK